MRRRHDCFVVLFELQARPCNQVCPEKRQTYVSLMYIYTGTSEGTRKKEKTTYTPSQGQNEKQIRMVRFLDELT